MHGLESDAIVKLYTLLFIKFKSCLQKCLIISMWAVSGNLIFVNILEGFALIYRLCLCNKDIFLLKIFCTSLNCVAYY